MSDQTPLQWKLKLTQAFHQSRQGEAAEGTEGVGERGGSDENSTSPSSRETGAKVQSSISVTEPMLMRQGATKAALCLCRQRILNMFHAGFLCQGKCLAKLGDRTSDSICPIWGPGGLKRKVLSPEPFFLMNDMVQGKL